MQPSHVAKALGFTLMMIEGRGLAPAEAAARAKRLAILIEEFCSAGASENTLMSSVELPSSSPERLLEEAAYALQLCLACPALTWEAEHEADLVMRKISSLK